MKRYWKNNVVVCVVILLMSYYYFSNFAAQIPSEYKLVFNVVIVPICLGVISGLFLRGNLLNRLLYIIPVPVITVLLLEGDPAKPGLELVLIGPLLIFHTIGLVLIYLMVDRISRLLKRNS